MVPRTITTYRIVRFVALGFLVGLAGGLPDPGHAQCLEGWQEGVFEPPPVSWLCGDPVPTAHPPVREMLEREFYLAVWYRAQVILWLKRAGRYFPHIEERLAAEGLPDDLKYLAVAESDLQPHVRSRAGAVGTWQFMPGTGRRYGLRTDRTLDERRHFLRSTDAALRYLHDLKETFGTWMLAMAAYNCGEKRLQREIDAQRVADYFRLNLPLETERFVFRILAIKMIMEHPTCYGYALPREHRWAPLEVDEVLVRVDTPLHLTDVAQHLETDFKTVKELNPQIRGRHLPVGRYLFTVPDGAGARTLAVVRRLQADATPLTRTVRPGDTLSAIAHDAGVSVDDLRRLNGISGSLIRVGETLRLR